MQVPLSPFQWLNEYVHVIAWPTLVGIIAFFCWKMRGIFDQFLKRIEEDRLTALATQSVTAEIKGVVLKTQDNHLVHLADDMAEQKKLQGQTIECIADQTKILLSIDKGIAILVDRSK